MTRFCLLIASLLTSATATAADPPVIVGDRQGFSVSSTHATPAAAQPTPVFSTKSDPPYTNYREPVAVRTNSGKLVVGIHAGNRHAWPE